MAAPMAAAVARGLRWAFRAASAGPPSRRAGGAAGAGRDLAPGVAGAWGTRGRAAPLQGSPGGFGRGRADAVRWEEGAVSVLGRFRGFYTVALSAVLLESCARCSGSGSALGHILGLPSERPTPALGRHPPPVATSRGERSVRPSRPLHGVRAPCEPLLPPQRSRPAWCGAAPTSPQSPKC